jgi:hypothetical protein
MRALQGVLGHDNARHVYHSVYIYCAIGAIESLEYLQAVVNSLLGIIYALMPSHNHGSLLTPKK